MNSKLMRLNALNDTCCNVSSFVLSHFLDQNFSSSIKKDGSTVTSVDIEAELLAKDTLLTAFSEDSFLGEEGGEAAGTSGYRWVVDPIDGTTSFTRGVPLFGTLIGLEYHGEPIAGIASLPALNETISAVIGEGVVYNSNNGVEMSTVSTLQDALICTTSYDYFKETNSETLYSRLLETESSLRGWSDCFAYLLLCTGKIDAVVEPLLYPWDIIPWLPILKEAGGKYSTIAQGGIASNALLHDHLCHALSCTT